MHSKLANKERQNGDIAWACVMKFFSIFLDKFNVFRSLLDH